MRTTSIAKVAALCGLLALSGCASKITQPDKYSGFLNNYSDLKETTSATVGCAFVSVPVLSNTMVSASAIASRYFPPLTVTL